MSDLWVGNWLANFSVQFNGDHLVQSCCCCCCCCCRRAGIQPFWLGVKYSWAINGRPSDWLGNSCWVSVPLEVQHLSIWGRVSMCLRELMLAFTCVSAHEGTLCEERTSIISWVQDIRRNNCVFNLLISSRWRKIILETIKSRVSVQLELALVNQNHLYLYIKCLQGEQKWWGSLCCVMC